MIPSAGFDATSSTTIFRSLIRSCMAVNRTSRLAVNRYGFGNGGASLVRPFPKSIPRPAPVSVLDPLFAGARVPLSRTRSFDLSTPLPCARTANDQTSITSNAIVKRNIIDTLNRVVGKRNGDSQIENRLTVDQIQATYDLNFGSTPSDEAF